MSKVEKLAIQGIRSFGPDDSRRIEFYTPLTLILGQNGCGKTTIIESLKYITTGEVPPGCGRGVAFVHDPKVAKETAVRGQVKLRFSNTRGQQITSTRSLEVTQKAKKLECKTLDATITYVGPDGKKASISSKCADFQAEMTSLLGVAKPILENVIFCHQEDSNWPLDEGKKVKDKFDSIFNATKYIKCLETIRKIRKDQKQKVTNMKETLEALKMAKEQAARLRKDFNDVEKDQSAIKDQQQKMKDDQEPIRKRIKEINQIENNIASYQGDLGGKEHQLRSIRQMQEELRASQNESYTCSDHELFRLIRDFERNTIEQERKQRELEESIRKLDADITRLKREESTALLMMGKLEAAQKSHSDKIKERNGLLNEIIMEYNIAGCLTKTDYNFDEAQEVLGKLSRYIEKERESINKKKEEFEVKEAEMQAQLDKLRSEQATFEHDITSKAKHLKDIEMKNREARQNLSKNEDLLASTNLDELQQNLETIAQKIQQEEMKVNTVEIAQEIEANKEKREKVEKELDDVKRKVTKLNKQVQARSQHDSYQNDRTLLEQKNQHLKRKNSDDFQALFSGPVGDNIRNELEAQLANIKRQITDTRDTVNDLKKEKTELEINIKNNKNMIKTKENEAKEFEDELQDLCRGLDLEDAIDKGKKKLGDLTHLQGSLKSFSFIYEKFKEELNAGEACPLCHREFNNTNNVEELVREIEIKLQNLPERIKQASKDLKSHTLEVEKLVQLQPQKQAADKAKAEIESLRTSLNELYSKLQTTNNELEGCSGKLDFLLSEEETAMRVQPDVIAIDSNIKTIRGLTEKISNLQATFDCFEENVTMDGLMKLQTELEQQLKIIRKKIESSQEEIMEHSRQLQRLKDRKIALSTTVLEMKNKQQESEKLRDEIKKYKEEKLKLEDQIEESKCKIAPLKYEIKDKLEAKNKMKIEKDSCITERHNEFDVIRQKERKIQDFHEAIKKYVNNNREKELEQSKMRLEELQTSCHSNDKAKREIQNNVNEVLKELSRQRERKRNLEDEKKIREKEVESVKLKQEIEELETLIKDFNYDVIHEEKKSLISKDDKICRTFENNKGRLEELAKKKRELETNLNNKGIKNAEKNYKEKLIQMKCIDIACDDLNKYYKALDTAIMKFHLEKMSRINSIIRELWRTTYKGNDIDYIEIKTDESESQGADKRRTYNYRVVMVKNDVDMDMRARCSAGQKVLASLIIRMALAETFSSNCGILALDEPTTNLDRENIESLSLALLNIVNKRSQQRNFQLIVITHDDEFLESLTRADYIEYYYKVSRNDRGLSMITRCAVNRV